MCFGFILQRSFIKESAGTFSSFLSKTFYPKNSTHVSVYNWIIKYATIVSKLTDNISIQCGNEMMSDEMEYHRRLYHQKGMKGIEQNWFVDTFDVETRFMIIGEYRYSL